MRSVLAHNNTTKLDEIELLAAEYNFAVVYLTETWLDNSIDNIQLLYYLLSQKFLRNFTQTYLQLPRTP